MNKSLGPGSSTKLEIKRNLSALILEHSKYVLNLPLFDQFILWRYTLGSGTLSTFLIGLPIQDTAKYWIFLFFKYYKYSVSKISTKYKKFLEYFKSPELYLKLNSKIQDKITKSILTLYSKDLQRIILNSPKVKNPIIVYKTSSEYPLLPKRTEYKNISLKKPFIVEQALFNSTTYDPQFNFAPFTTESSDCCMYEIHIEKGQVCLYIPSEIHAYPHEREIILPMKTSFKIIKVSSIELDFISTSDQQFIQVQNPISSIGEVFRVDPISIPNVKNKRMNFFETIF